MSSGKIALPHTSLIVKKARDDAEACPLISHHIGFEKRDLVKVLVEGGANYLHEAAYSGYGGRLRKS